MTKFIKTTIVVSLTFIYSSVTFTDDHEAPMIVPMEHFAVIIILERIEMMILKY